MRTSAAGNKAWPPQGLPRGAALRRHAGPPFVLRSGPAQAFAPWRAPRARALHGFTLLELLLVLALMLLATAGVSLALRDGAELRLERDAQRLLAMLNAAQAQSQATGVPVRWSATPQGFRLDGLIDRANPLAQVQRWLDPDTMVQGPAPVLLLGPEPVLPPQVLLLASRARPGQSLRLASDGLRPFSLQASP
jgi:general secretion pathway protein H